MDFFKQWAISVCASGIIGTIFSMIAPKGSMDKILKLMISVFIFTSMLAPFLTGGKIKIDDFFSPAQNDSVSEDTLWEQTNQLTLKTTKASVEKTIGDFLKQQGCQEYKVKVQLHADENNYVVIDAAELYLLPEDGSRWSELKEKAQQEFQITMSVFEMGAYEDEFDAF